MIDNTYDVQHLHAVMYSIQKSINNAKYSIEISHCENDKKLSVCIEATTLSEQQSSDIVERIKFYLSKISIDNWKDMFDKVFLELSLTLNGHAITIAWHDSEKNSYHASYNNLSTNKS